MLSAEQLDLWCCFLEAHPELQGKFYLHNLTDNTMCCMGALCHVLGLPGTESEDCNNTRCVCWCDSISLLEGDAAALLAPEGGDANTLRYAETGYFDALRMPSMLYDGKRYYSLAQANDAGVPWARIAAHLREYYPTSTTKETV